MAPPRCPPCRFSTKGFTPPWQLRQRGCCTTGSNFLNFSVAFFSAPRVRGQAGPRRREAILSGTRKAAAAREPTPVRSNIAAPAVPSDSTPANAKATTTAAAAPIAIHWDAGMRRAQPSSASRSMPVSYPIAWNMCTRSSVHTLPLAPGANGHPPKPPSDASKRSMPARRAASALARPIARVS